MQLLPLRLLSKLKESGCTDEFGANGGKMNVFERLSIFDMHVAIEKDGRTVVLSWVHAWVHGKRRYTVKPSRRQEQRWVTPDEESAAQRITARRTGERQSASGSEQVSRSADTTPTLPC